MTFKGPVTGKSKVETTPGKVAQGTESSITMFWREPRLGIRPVQNVGLWGKQKSVQIQGNGTSQGSPGGIF